MNKPGINYQIEYQESLGVNRIAKFDGVWSINFGFGTQDPEFQVLVPGNQNWNGSFQWLRYLGTDGKIWRTRTHAKQYSLASKSGYTIEMESMDIDGNGNNSTFQFIDWADCKWNVEFISADLEGRDKRPVSFFLKKIE